MKMQEKWLLYRAHQRALTCASKLTRSQELTSSMVWAEFCGPSGTASYKLTRERPLTLREDLRLVVSLVFFVCLFL